MARCIQLAKNAWEQAPPNPMVGAVVVCDGRIIGEGYHVRCGEGHAEVNALASVKPEDEHLLSQSTIYVSLEPCAHYGKTPPCADLIVRKGLRRCVVGCVDPFAKVQGRGIEKLRAAGIDVTVGVLEKECQELNKRFMTFHRLHRPFITLKWAQASDGVIGLKAVNSHPQNIGEQENRQQEPLRVSNEFTQMICHKRRAEHEAILVGRGTVENDRPSLTVRAWYGRHPQRVMLGRKEKLDASLPDNCLDGWLCFDSIAQLTEGLWQRGVQSLLVEGGHQTLQSFIDAGVWDEAFVETGNKPFEADERQPVFAPNLRNADLVDTAWYDGHRIDEWHHTPFSPGF